MPCGSRRSVQGPGRGGGCGTGRGAGASSPLALCHRPWPHPPGGRRAGGSCVASSRSACPAGSGGWAPQGTGCHTLSRPWPRGTRRAPAEDTQPGLARPVPEAHTGPLGHHALVSPRAVLHGAAPMLPPLRSGGFGVGPCLLRGVSQCPLDPKPSSCGPQLCTLAPFVRCHAGSCFETECTVSPTLHLAGPAC